MAVLTSPIAPTHDIGGARFTSLATPSLGSTDTSVWMVEIDPGTPANPHELTREEVFVVLSGHARVQLAGHEHEAAPGDAIVVPPNTPFALSAAGADPLRALCCFPVGGQARLADGAAFTPPWAV
ncbi:cupin domain-containing protein [Pseudonocardia sp. GCM10023141]|uniref:cupin domain-containing protein n=1 Tax=Pseudonocardia sp. GCM10023141 TaxID=3252653 RepID=UPI00361F2841